MEGKLWSRRQAIKVCARMAAGLGLARLAPGSIAEAQLPAPAPLQDAARLSGNARHEVGLNRVFISIPDNRVMTQSANAKAN
jgi:hypothetical protein